MEQVSQEQVKAEAEKAIESATPVPTVDDSEFDLPESTIAEVLGVQAYQMIIQHNQLAINEKANESVGNKDKASAIHKDMQLMRNAVAYTYQKCPDAKKVVARIKKEDADRATKLQNKIA